VPLELQDNFDLLVLPEKAFHACSGTTIRIGISFLLLVETEKKMHCYRIMAKTDSV
jgi:hypothetical protein